MWVLVGGIGILIKGDSNTLSNLTIDSNINGIEIREGNNNSITDFSIWNTFVDGIYIYQSSNNTFENGIVNVTMGDGIEISSANAASPSSNNLFKDMSITNIDDFKVKVVTTGDGIVINNTLLNVSYASDSGETFSLSGGAGELIRKWYYQAYVNDTNSNIVSNANITSYNYLGLDFSVLVNVSGWIENKQEITEYVNVGGTNYYSEVYVNKDSYYEVGYYLDETKNNLNSFFTLSNEYGYYENKVTGQNFNVSITDLTNALIYYSNNSIGGSSNINSNDGNINIILIPNNYSYVLDNFNLTEGVTRTYSPLWFSFSTTKEKHIASNLTDTINATVVFNVRSCDIKFITYTSNSSNTIYEPGYSCVNNTVTIENLRDIEPAIGSGVLKISYNNLTGLASTIIKLLIGFLALIVLGSTLVGIFIYTKNNFQEVTMLTLMNYFILLLITLFLMIALINYIIITVL